MLYGFVFLFHDYLKAHDFPEAGRYLFEAEGIAKVSGNIGWQGAMSHQRAVLLLRMRNIEEALSAYKTAADLCGQARDSLCVAESLEQISGMYGQLNNFEEAQKYLDIALPMIKKFGGDEQLATTLNNFGILLSQQNRPKEGIPYIQRAITLYQQQEKHKEEAQAINNLADAYRRLRQYNLAIETYRRCIKINKAFNLQENLIINYMGLYVLYEEKADFRTANYFLIKHYDVRDSLIGAETQQKIAELDVKYQSSAKELALQKSQAELTAAQRTLEHIGVGIMIALLLVSFGIWRWRVQNLLAKRELTQNKENLANLTQLFLEKNQLLVSLEAQLTEQSKPREIGSVAVDFEDNLYNQRILTDEDWSAFKGYFDKAYPGYLSRLRSEYPKISDAEERLFLFIKLNLNSKEIAAILGISAGSVKKTRYRLRKRLGLEEYMDLDEYIRTFELNEKK